MHADDEKKYWSTFKDIKNINKIGDIIEREVTISAGPQNSKCHQLVIIFPEQLKIQANLTEGIITGTRTLMLEPISENESRLKVLWDIDLSGIPTISRALQKMVLSKLQKMHFAFTNIELLHKILTVRFY